MSKTKFWWMAVLVTLLNLCGVVYTAVGLEHSQQQQPALLPPVAPSATAATVAPATSAAPASSSVPHVLGVKSLADMRTIDGINMSALDRFWDKWPLVDVRYRKDNGEQRFVYANEIAWKAIKDGAKTYPDGAMLGKVAFHGVPDPAFPASVEPAAFSRLQIMKKDSKAYRDTDGWGYAVVTGVDAGKETAAEDLQVAAACHACHRLVPERDYVFSRTPFLPTRNQALETGLKAKFQPSSVQELSEREQHILQNLDGKQGREMIRYLPMPLFVGSVDEASIPLASFATADHSIYFMSDPQTGHFVLADGTPSATGSAEPGCQPGTRVWVTFSTEQPGIVPDHVSERRLCGDIITLGHLIDINSVVK